MDQRLNESTLLRFAIKIIVRLHLAADLFGVAGIYILVA